MRSPLRLPNLWQLPRAAQNAPSRPISSCHLPFQRRTYSQRLAKPALTSDVPGHPGIQLSSSRIVGLPIEGIREMVSRLPQDRIDAIINEATIGSGREHAAWFHLFILNHTMSNGNPWTPQEHRIVRANLDSILSASQKDDMPRLECVARLVILRAALGSEAGCYNKLVHESARRLGRLRKELGREGLGDLFLPTLTVCAQYSQEMAAIGAASTLGVEPFEYIYSQLDSWKTDKHPFVDVVSLADFYVWYAHHLETLGEKEEAKRLLEIAAYEHGHADGFDRLRGLLDHNSRECHSCLLSLASIPDKRGAEAAMDLARMYSLPNEQFKNLDAKLQHEINTTSPFRVKDILPKLSGKSPESTKKLHVEILQAIMREYTKLGAIQREGDFLEQLNAPARILKALYWYHIAVFNSYEASAVAIELSDQYALLWESGWMKLASRCFSATRYSFAGEDYDEQQKQQAFAELHLKIQESFETYMRR